VRLFVDEPRLSPDRQATVQQLVPSPSCRQHHQLGADSGAAPCHCHRRHRHADTFDTLSLDCRHEDHNSEDGDDDDDGERMSLTWRRRSDVDVRRTGDSVEQSRSSLLSPSPDSSDRPQTVSLLSLSSQNVLLVNNSSSLAASSSLVAIES